MEEATPEPALDVESAEVTSTDVGLWGRHGEAVANFVQIPQEVVPHRMLSFPSPPETQEQRGYSNGSLDSFPNDFIITE